MTLYELKAEWLALYNMMDDPELDEDTVLDTIEAIDGEIELKAEGYASIIAQLEADADGFKKEIERLTARKKTIEGNIQRLKSNLQAAMEATGKTKFKSGLFSFNIQNNPPKLIIDHPGSVPDQFLIKQEPKVDTAKVKELLKDTLVAWAHLEQGRSLRIK